MSWRNVGRVIAAVPVAAALFAAVGPAPAGAVTRGAPHLSTPESPGTGEGPGNCAMPGGAGVAGQGGPAGPCQGPGAVPCAQQGFGAGGPGHMAGPAVGAVPCQGPGGAPGAFNGRPPTDPTGSIPAGSEAPQRIGPAPVPSCICPSPAALARPRGHVVSLSAWHLSIPEGPGTGNGVAGPGPGAPDEAPHPMPIPAPAPACGCPINAL